ncbi:nucleotide exchange factor GrpE [Methylocapsa sp. D3K7]|uniref:nucleotide exchange factor GrpE n=1 Tax=Methylocapsa sp. D3K7 TaxID=3041435 RepID=UPI00244E825A|nr:nucleotide exchange factor GrpE [Methylocapsa sp. D3K7]WGJ16512.1 nucleotide exchange factor GrpE [Methylocapsa sp. D3K7]
MKRPDLDSTETGSKEVVNDAAIFSNPSSSVVIDEESDSEADSAPNSQDDLSALLSHLEARLLDAFNQKLAFDNFKEKQIDRLHEELQGYKSDLLLKAAQPLIAAMIKLHAGAGRLIIGISQEDPTKLTAERIIGFFDNFRDEIADILAARGVEMFLTAVGEQFDVRRQSSVGTVETSNLALAGRVAETAQPGFELGSTVLSKEKVKIYSATCSGADEPKS